MCSWVLFHFYFSDVWSGSFSGLAFLYLNLPSLLARRGRNVQILGQIFNRNTVDDFVIFLIHLVRGPGVESFATNRGFEQKESKYRENWAIETPSTFMKLCSPHLLPPGGMVWVWGAAKYGPPSPCVPSVYHGQSIRVENLLHVSMYVWFL